MNTMSTHGAEPASPDSQRSLMMLLAIPFCLIGGFLLGSLLLGDPNSADAPQRWAAAARLIPFWALLEVPSVIGMFWGARAMRAGDRRGRAGLLLNGLVFVFFVLVTLVGGLVDAFNGV